MHGCRGLGKRYLVRLQWVGYDRVVVRQTWNARRYRSSGHRQHTNFLEWGTHGCKDGPLALTTIRGLQLKHMLLRRGYYVRVQRLLTLILFRLRLRCARFIPYSVQRKLVYTFHFYCLFYILITLLCARR